MVGWRTSSEVLTSLLIRIYRVQGWRKWRVRKRRHTGRLMKAFDKEELWSQRCGGQVCSWNTTYVCKKEIH